MNVKRVWVLYSFLILVFFILGCSQQTDNPPFIDLADSEGKGETQGKLKTEEKQEVQQLNTAIVEIFSSGFNPKTVTIKAGDAVMFINRDSNAHWPASVVHPTHTIYPGSGIEKCDTAEENTIFDACRQLTQDESWSFIFKEKGTWKFHDHLNPQSMGTIVVE